MAQTATDLTKEQLNVLKKELKSQGLLLNPDGTVNPINEAYKKASDEYNAKLLAKGKADNKIAKTAEIGNTAMNVAGGVLGLGQMIGGAKILGKTKAPKYPYEQLPNQQLSARLGDVQRLSQIGDPIIREKMMRDMAMQNAKNDAVAKVSSGGDVASYAAQSQVNSSANNDAIRNIGASELAFKTQQGGILDGLIAQKIQEDNAIQKGKIDKFTNVDLPEFKARRNYGEQLVNKGIGNVFNAGIGAGQNATVLARTKQNEALFDAQTPKVLTEQQLAMSTPMTAMSTSKVVPTPTAQPTATITTPQFNLSGLLPNAYETMNGKNPAGIGVLKPIVKGDGSLLSYGQQQTIVPTVQPTWDDSTLKSQGDMSYMATPQGYAQYKSKVAQIPKEKLMYNYQNQINPETKKPYTYEELVNGMTDGKIGSKHRMAQTLINELGL